MRRLVHPATLAFGAASIVMFPLLKPLASTSHKEFYHWTGPVSWLLVPVLVNFAAVWLCLALVLLWARRRFSKGSAALSVLIGSVSWMVADLYKLHRYPYADRVVWAIALGCGVLLGIQALLTARRWPLLREANALAATILGFVAVAGVLTLGEALVFSWQARGLNNPQTLHVGVKGASAPGGRIVWIIFDELSYRQVYERPYPGLKLSAFGRLAETAAVFSQVVPSGLYTEAVLPSLITGRRYDRTRAGPKGLVLEGQRAAGGEWERIDPHNTVFEDALLAGYRTGVAGWYMPYCRILPAVLDACFWTVHELLPGGMSAGQSLESNIEQPIVHPLLSFWRRLEGGSATAYETTLHQQDYMMLVAEGDKLIRDPAITFVLLHLPIPHPGGIYNRVTGTFATGQSSYLDNLALCDVYVAHVREEMERNGTWEGATVLIMGDHSWRVHLGVAKTPEWTEEEQVASDGARFDDRPLYVVKLPDERVALRVAARFEAVRTRDLIDLAILGRMQRPEQLAAWASGMK